MTAETNDQIKKITIAEVEGYVGIADSCVEQLLQAARQLPRVEEDGSSECPFAEERYAIKEEAQRDAEICLEKLGAYLSWVDDQIGRCENNLQTISSGQQQLNTDSARDKLSEAEEQLDAFRKRLTKLRDDIEDAMKKVDKALQESVGKRFPGKIPQKNPQFTVPPSVPFWPDSNSSQGNSGSADENLKEMLSMGPIQ